MYKLKYGYSGLKPRITSSDFLELSENERLAYVRIVPGCSAYEESDNKQLERTYKKLKGLFRSLYEAELELSMFREDNETIDSVISEYLESLQARIQGYTSDIKEIIDKSI